MKGVSMRRIIPALLALMMVLSASGTLVAVDNFDYAIDTAIAPGGTIGEANTNGFSNAWKISGYSGTVVENLTFPGVESSGAALKLNYDSAGYLFRGMTDSLAAGTYYMSMIFYRDDVDNGGSENWRWELRHSSSYSSGPTSGTKVVAGSTSGEAANILVAGDSYQSGVNTYDIGSTVFMLVKFVIDDSGSETASMKWYNYWDEVPGDDSEIVWDATSTGEFSGGSGWKLTLGSYNTSFTVDEFRFGTTFADVAPAGSTLLVYDSFDYELGTEIASNSILGSIENGFANEWLFGNDAYGEVVSNLVFSGLKTSGNALKIYNPSGSGYLFRGMSGSLTTGTYYMSSIVYRDDTDNGGGENWRWEIRHALSHASGPASSIKVSAGSTSDEAANLLVDGDSFQSGTNTYNVGSPVLMLLKVEVDDFGSETASMKFYNFGDSVPAVDSGIEWDAVSTGEFSGGSGWKLGLASLIGSMTIDEFRLARSLPDVLPAGAVIGGYTGWALSYGVQQGITGDDDSDGLSNLYEYGLHGDPTDAGDQGISPQVFVSNGSFGYVYPQLADSESGLLYYLETTDDLLAPAWTNAGYFMAGTNVTGGDVNYVTNLVPTDADMQFIKLIIEQE